MINTKCPECSARFYVSEELVVGKVVRFRCRKCGGTITVDGTHSTPDASKDMTEGSDDMLLSRYPPAPSAGGDLKIKEPDKQPGTLRPPAGPAMPAMPAPKGSEEVPFEPPPAPVSDGGEATKSAEEGVKDRIEAEKVEAEKVEGPTVKAATVDGETTALWQKKKDERQAEPSSVSKPRLSRVSMDLGSVFEMPADEEEVEIPMDLDDAPAFEEEIDAEPISLIPGSIGPQAHGLNLAGLKPPPAPKIKPPPPKPRARNLDRVSSAHVDISAALARRDEDDFSDAPAELFASVAMPQDAPTDEAIETIVKKEQVLAPALPISEVAKEPSLDDSRDSRSNRWLWLGAVAAVFLLTALGIYLIRGMDGDPAEVAHVTVTEQDEANDTPQAPLAESSALPETDEEPPKPEDVGRAASEPVGKVATGTTPTATAALAPTAATAPAVPAAPAAPAAPATTGAVTAPTAEPATPAAAPATAPAKVKSPTPPESGTGAFDRSAAASSIGSLKGAAQGCKQPGGPQGHASVSITFAPTGRVTVATVNGPPFAGTPVGGCIASTFRRASVPPFSGPNVTVRTTVPIF